MRWFRQIAPSAKQPRPRRLSSTMVSRLRVASMPAREIHSKKRETFEIDRRMVGLLWLSSATQQRSPYRHPRRAWRSTAARHRVGSLTDLVANRPQLKQIGDAVAPQCSASLVNDRSAVDFGDGNWWQRCSAGLGLGTSFNGRIHQAALGLAVDQSSLKAERQNSQEALATATGMRILTRP
jgi:hypothetical protein